MITLLDVIKTYEGNFGIYVDEKHIADYQSSLSVDRKYKDYVVKEMHISVINDVIKLNINLWHPDKDKFIKELSDLRNDMMIDDHYKGKVYLLNKTIAFLEKVEHKNPD